MKTDSSETRINMRAPLLTSDETPKSKYGIVFNKTTCVIFLTAMLMFGMIFHQDRHDVSLEHLVADPAAVAPAPPAAGTADKPAAAAPVAPAPAAPEAPAPAAPTTPGLPNGPCTVGLQPKACAANQQVCKVGDDQSETQAGAVGICKRFNTRMPDCTVDETESAAIYPKLLAEAANPGTDMSGETLCTKYLNWAVQVRAAQECRVNRWRHPSSFNGCKEKIDQVVTGLGAASDETAKKDIVAGLFAYLIGTQLLLEGNNRSAYLMVTVMSKKFQVPIPTGDQARQRKERYGKTFDEAKLKEQFKKLYTI